MCSSSHVPLFTTALYQQIADIICDTGGFGPAGSAPDCGVGGLVRMISLALYPFARVSLKSYYLALSFLDYLVPVGAEFHQLYYRCSL
jgi:hypothetical protein